MKFVSTRGESPAVGFGEALLNGVAPDGGLYLPEAIPEIPPERRATFRSASLADIAIEVSRPYVDRLPADEVEALCRDAFDFDVPLVPLEDDVSILELFHGPTLAFKDVGARFMARLMSAYLRETGESRTILVATSGDTGGAVAQAFHRVPSTRVGVLYPRGRVSPVQEKQFTTLGDNVFAFAVEGAFDDCQRLVKQAFADDALRNALDLTSANSINVGRLLPQSFYYFLGAARSPAPPVFSTPSGNFGNLCAGLMAKRAGLDAGPFVAATNANDVVPEYLDTGVFTPRPSVATMSNAMDVGDPSNFDRILRLYDGDVQALRWDVKGSRHSDEATRAEIRRVREATGYILDPHTAVGVLGLREVRERERLERPGIVLATAHPAKFREGVEPLIGGPVKLPASLEEAMGRETRAVPIPAELEALRAALRDAFG